MQLVEIDIEPAIELESNFFEGAAATESQFLVKLDAGQIVGIDNPDHGMESLGAGSVDDLLQQTESVAVSTVVSFNIHGMFNRLAVGGVRAERSVGGEADQLLSIRQ